MSSEAEAQPMVLDDRRDDSARLFLWAVLAFAVVSLVLNVTSRGFLEADGITHYLYARWALEQPWRFTDIWGRPIVTTLHALPAQLPGEFLGQPWGLIAVRLVSLILAIGCAIMAWRIARRMPDLVRPAMAGVFTLAGPLVLLHSFSELTELPFALMAIVCLWAYQRRQWGVLAVVAGLLPAARPEGFGFLLLAVGGLLLHRRWLALPLVMLGLVAWATIGWLLGGQPWVPDESPFRPMFDVLPSWIAGPIAWLPTNWPYSGESVYEPGPLLKFVGMLPWVVGPGLLPFTIIGAIVSFRGGRDLLHDHAVRVRWITAFVPLFVLVVHSLLHWTGKMASSGDVRYLATVIPFWGLLTARGFDVIAEALPIRWPKLTAVLLWVLPLVALQWVYPLVPLEMVGDAVGAEKVAAWYASDESAELRARYPNLRVDHPVFLYASELVPTQNGTRAMVEQPPPATMFLWHEVYSEFNADVDRTVSPEVLLQYGWRDVTPPDLPEDWRVFVHD